MGIRCTLWKQNGLHDCGFILIPKLQGLNVALFWEKVDFSEYVQLIPTSAITGDGVGDLIALLVEYSSKKLVNALMLSMEIEAMVMEVGKTFTASVSMVQCAH